MNEEELASEVAEPPTEVEGYAPPDTGLGDAGESEVPVGLESLDIDPEAAATAAEAVDAAADSAVDVAAEEPVDAGEVADAPVEDAPVDAEEPVDAGEVADAPVEDAPVATDEPGDAQPQPPT